MKDYKKELVLGLIVLCCAGFLVWKLSQSRPGGPAVDNCGQDLQTKTMQDEWMKGAIEKGSEYQALMDWRACYPLKRGDFVLFRISQSHDPVVRIVAGIPGDKFQLVKDKNGNSWNIEINGETFMEGEKPYHFGSANPPALKLYQDSRKGILDQSSVLLFSKVSPGDQDSGSLGVISEQDIVGVVKTSK